MFATAGPTDRQAVPALIEKALSQRDLANLDRIEAIYRAEPHVPDRLFAVLDEQRQRFSQLLSTRGEHVPPDVLISKVA